MLNFNCVNCRKDVFVEKFISKEYEVDGKKLVISGIPVIQCSNCNESYFDKKASEYIDNQIKIFKSEGLENRTRELAKAKGLTQEQIGNHLELSKQRISQIFSSESIDIKIAYKLSNIMKEPIQEIFKLHNIIQREDKYYIEN
ncbi:hypothetical protein BC351_10435 [Paenibacillus ferrarius]|uniref:HTH cro/C1-type domain-containing protein n=1 Tax=Paenibacillus ferrarius TaxID=1469647 RepID=A0A1V4H8R3_9BACL|nr:YgiT-type zinc finger protein [Paenibacillus ferrarius]OPH47600.1 hypothetical protein BC351_10435 [Paenibacillus ferrarius]